MEKEKTRFGIAVILGFIVMILFALVWVNRLDMIPVPGPFFGGIVAGYLAGKDFLNGGKAGLISGIFGAIAVSIDLMLNTRYLMTAIPSFSQLAGVLFLIVAIIYFPVLAFIGGALGGLLKG
jgi:hypothetical protein